MAEKVVGKPVLQPPENPIPTSFAVPIPQEGKPFNIASFDLEMERAGFIKAKFIVVEDPENAAVMHVFNQEVEHRAFWDIMRNPKLLCGGFVDANNKFLANRNIRWISGEASSLIPELMREASNAYMVDVLKPRLQPHFRVEVF